VLAFVGHLLVDPVLAALEILSTCGQRAFHRW
jgi:hypothetical protein